MVAIYILSNIIKKTLCACVYFKRKESERASVQVVAVDFACHIVEVSYNFKSYSQQISLFFILSHEYLLLLCQGFVLFYG